MLRMLKGESIADVQKQFTHIVNHLMSLGKFFDKEELNIKILKCLDRSWQPKVTAIPESTDLTSLTTTSLFGKLREHELEMNRLNIQENEDKHVRNIALKIAKSTRTTKFQVMRLNEKLLVCCPKCSTNRNKDSNKERYGKKKTSDFNANNYTCYGCGEQGHIKRKSQARWKGRQNKKEPTLLGTKMMSLHEAPHQVKMKKLICV